MTKVVIQNAEYNTYRNVRRELHLSYFKHLAVIRLYVSVLFIVFANVALKAQEEKNSPDSIQFLMNVYDSSNKLPLSNVKVSISGLSGKFTIDSLGWIDRKTEFLMEARRAEERGDKMDMPDFSDPMNNTIKYSGKMPYDSVLIVSLAKAGFEERTLRLKVNDADVYDGTAYLYAGKYGIYPEDKSLKLKEVTVTATKIKMYHNGDTLVYNADAFNLPDGSMLDALIRALPGATLSRAGQITINDEPVSELLVNGRKFFDGDPIIALENLPHYTVKDIKVYKKAPDEIAYSRKVEERDKTKDPLVLDVNLKREFMKGLITNYTLGGGVNVRNDPSMKWLGRIFALVHDSRIEYGLYIQGNNINSDASVDGSGRWSASDIYLGLVTSGKAGANFKIHWKDQDREGFNSNLSVSGRKRFFESESEQTNFFTEGTRWSTSERTRTTQSLNLRWNNVLTRHFSSGLFKTDINFGTEREKSDDSLNSRQGELDEQTSTPTDPLTEAIKYYQNTRSNDRSRVYEGSGRVSYSLDPYLIPWIARMQLSGKYDHRSYNSDYMSEQLVVYKDEPTNNFNQLSDGRQNRNSNSTELNLAATSAKYTYKKLSIEGSIDYVFSISDNSDDLNRYYDNLSAEEPALLSGSSAMLFDEINSYDSHSTENVNKFGVGLGLRFWNLHVLLASKYELNYRQYQEERVNNRIDIKKYTEMWTPSLTIDLSGLKYSFTTYLTLPQMRWLNDAEDTTDPMNIYRGNSLLRDSRSWVHTLGYYKSFGKRHHNVSASVDYRKVDNAISRARFLNTETGAIITTPMNINGNRSTSQSLSYSQSFGPRNRFFVQNSFIHNLRHNVDYSSEIDKLGAISTDYRTFSDNLTLSFSISDVVVRGNVDMRINRQTSEEYSFANARYSDIDYSLEVQGTLPWGIGLDTSLSLNTRYGYGNSDIDRPYWVWNLSLSKKFARHWLVKLHGYDILQQIPTFSRSIDSQFISINRYNTQPSYVLLSVTYSLTITPNPKHK